MDRTEEVEISAQDRIDDYLSSFKSKHSTFQGHGVADDAALEEYLLERAADELRIARKRLDRFEREFG